MAAACRLLVPQGVKKRTDLKSENIDNDEVSGAVAVCVEKITPGHQGKVEFRGSFWTAVSDTEINKGEDCIIISRDNLLLKVSRNTGSCQK